MERRREASETIDKLFAERFPPPPLVEFTGMRGGVSVSAAVATPRAEQIAAYGPLVKRLTPLWRRITSYRRDSPETWATDILQLPEVSKLTDEEVQAMRLVLDSIPHGRNTLKGARGGAPIRPATCAREHARVILDISERSDRKLIDIEAESNRITKKE